MSKKTIIAFFSSILIVSQGLLAQIGIGTSSPNPLSHLHIASSVSTGDAKLLLSNSTQSVFLSIYSGAEAVTPIISWWGGSDLNFISEGSPHSLRNAAVLPTPSLSLKPNGDIAVGKNIIATNGYIKSSPPVVKISDFIVADNEQWIIVNNKVSNCTATLPSPATCVGRSITIRSVGNAVYGNKIIGLNAVPNPDASNVIVSGAGKWATIVSDGTYWVIMAAN